MSSSPYRYPPGNSQIYRSAYSGGMVSDEKGMFHHFIRQPGPIHELNGYWRFSTFKDDRCAYRRGFATPEEILVAQDRGDASFDEIMLTWLPGKNDPTNGKALTGTPAAHLETIYTERRVLGNSMSLRGCIPFYPLANDKKLQIYRAQRYFGQDGTQYRLNTPPQAARLSSSLGPENEPPINPAYDSGSQHRQSNSPSLRTRSATKIARQNQDELSKSESGQQGNATDFSATLSHNSDGVRQSVKKAPNVKALPSFTQTADVTRTKTDSCTSTKLSSSQTQDSASASTSQCPLQRPALPPMQGLRGLNGNKRPLGSLPPANQRVSYYGNPFDRSQYQQRPNPHSPSSISEFTGCSTAPTATPLSTALPRTPTVSFPDSLRTTQVDSRATGASLSVWKPQLPTNPTPLRTKPSPQPISVETQLHEDGHHADTEVQSFNKRASLENVDEAVNNEGSSIVFSAQEPEQSQNLDRMNNSTLTVNQADVYGSPSMQTNQNVDTFHQDTAQSIGKNQLVSTGREYSVSPTHGHNTGSYSNLCNVRLNMGMSKSEALNSPSKAVPARKNSNTGIGRLSDGIQPIFTPPLTPENSQMQPESTHSLDEKDLASFHYVGELDSDEPTLGPADLLTTLPCMDCGQVDEHKWDCHIGHIGPMAASTILDYRNYAEDVQKFDPGPFIGENWHVGPPKDPEPEDTPTQIKGMVDIIRNEASFKNDLELQMLPDQLMVLLWAMKTSPGVEVIQW